MYDGYLDVLLIAWLVLVEDSGQGHQFLKRCSYLSILIYGQAADTVQCN